MAITLSAAVYAHMHTPHTLSYPMALFVGKPTASREEVFSAIRDYAVNENLYSPDRRTIKPDILMASLLGCRTPISIGAFNSLTARHLL
jgi:chromatin remodeling complex protein RSC6